MTYFIVALLSLLSFLILLNRLTAQGLDLGYLSQLAWKRRTRIHLLLDGDPLFNLSSPLEVAAMYLVALAKADGEVSIKSKHRLLLMFQHDFELTQKQAIELLESCDALLGDGRLLFDNPKRILEPCYHLLEKEQVDSLQRLLITIVHVDGPPSARQKSLCKKISKSLPLSCALS